MTSGQIEIPLPDLHGRCHTSATLEVVRRLADDLDQKAELHRLVAAEGIEADGTATRWEAHFDLPSRQTTLEAVVTFRWSEEDGAYGEGVAALREVAFPPPGSELARMGADGVLSRRRIRGVWRQQLRERRYLPPVIPPLEAALAAAGDDGPWRRVEAVVLRTEGPVWRLQGRRRHQIRFDTLQGR